MDFYQNSGNSLNRIEIHHDKSAGDYVLYAASEFVMKIKLD